MSRCEGLEPLGSNLSLDETDPLIVEPICKIDDSVNDYARLDNKYCRKPYLHLPPGCLTTPNPSIRHQVRKQKTRIQKLKSMPDFLNFFQTGTILSYSFVT